jgi:hypothetical protein
LLLAAGCQASHYGDEASATTTTPAASDAAVTGTPQPANAAKPPSIESSSKPSAGNSLDEASGHAGAPVLTAQTTQNSDETQEGKLQTEKEADLKPTQPTQVKEPTTEASEASILGVAEDQPDAVPGKTKTESHQKFSPANPTLMGLQISVPRKTVVSQYGNPDRTFVMDDGEDPVYVSEYKGFTVGFTMQDQLEFVEINSASVDPGLNGLRWGDHADKALKALGMPETNTGYVISYKGKNAVLKLDIDPKTEVIRSIKLFAKSK